MIALKGHWPTLPDVRLYHNPDKVARRVGTIEDVEDAGTQTWATSREAVVLLTYQGDRVAEDALLVHEAYCIVQRHYRNENPGEEVMANSIRVVSKALMRAQEQWRERHRMSCEYHQPNEEGHEHEDRTCSDLGGTGANGEQVFNCSKCGCVLSLYDRDGSNNLCTSFVHDYPRFCPECGRMIVSCDSE